MTSHVFFSVLSNCSQFFLATSVQWQRIRRVLKDHNINQHSVSGEYVSMNRSKNINFICRRGTKKDFLKLLLVI